MHEKMRYYFEKQNLTYRDYDAKLIRNGSLRFLDARSREEEGVDGFWEILKSGELKGFSESVKICKND